MNIEKRNTFSNDIIFIDGLWGTGKSLLGPIVSAMSGVERVKIESIYEYTSWLYHLGKIELDAAIWILRTYSDTSQYHNLIGREVNLRWSDDTGLKNANNKMTTLARLFGKEGDFKVSEINEKNLAFCAMSHMLMLSPELLSSAYGKRVRVIEVVRHPLYMVNHYISYLERFESPREFTISYYVNDKKIPWFVKDWQEEFLSSNTTEKAILCISRTYKQLFKNIDDFKNRDLMILDMSFEEIVFHTEDALKKFSRFTGREQSKNIKSILKKQILPRKSLSAGRGHASYGWKKHNFSEELFYMTLIEDFKSKCSESVFGELIKITGLYNKLYPSPLVLYDK